jgi:hypothetical protein
LKGGFSLLLCGKARSCHPFKAKQHRFLPFDDKTDALLQYVTKPVFVLFHVAKPSAFIPVKLSKTLPSLVKLRQMASTIILYFFL